MSDTHGRHDASWYRGLVRESKSGYGKHPTKLLDEARRIRDPYYVSLALFDLSFDSRLGMKKSTSSALESLEVAYSVEQLWRRAEVLSKIVKKIGSWRDEKWAFQVRERLKRGVLESVLDMPEGKGLSDAISGCAPSFDCDSLLPLLSKAVSNRGFESSDGKAVIRQWARFCKDSSVGLDNVLKILLSIDDGVVRSRLLGYLHLQCRKSKMPVGSINPLVVAVDEALKLKEGRLEVLQYLTRQSSSLEELEVISGVLDRLDDPSDRAMLLSTIGGVADKSGLKEMAILWFKEGVQEVKLVEDVRKRTVLRLKLASGLGRCGENDLALEVYQDALDDCGDDLKLRKMIDRSMEDQGLRSSGVKKVKEGELKVSSAAADTDKVHDMICLFNAYEGGLKPVHLRAVARAAPLCSAFGLDLALMGFPTDDLKALVSQVIKETNIGRGGRYLDEMVESGRIVLVALGKKGVPWDWSNLGMPVATTSHPSKGKRVGMKEAVLLSKPKHPLGRVCLVMGLGKKGLPESFLKSVPYHLELTGSDIALETATAMGVIAEQLRQVRV